MSRRAIVAVVMLLLLTITTIPQVMQPTIAANPPPTMGGTFIVGVVADPTTLNPGLTTNLNEQTAADPAFNSLLETNHNGSISPGLAQSYQMSPDGLTYTFNLVKNATWHDGVKFTSADVKYTFQSIIIPLHPEGQVNFGVVSSIDTPDPYTVVFHLSHAWPSFLLFVGNTFDAPILPAHIYNGTNIQNNPANFAPIGTGPFIFKEWVRGDHITYVRNPNYWRAGKPYLDSIIIKVFTDINTMVAALQSGEINYAAHYITGAMGGSVKNLETMSNINVTSKGYEDLPAISWLYFNLNNTYLKNLKVRQAIVSAINKTQISVASRFGFSPPGVSPVSQKSTWAYDPNIQPQYPYNVTYANQLLDQAGYPKQANGTRFTLQFDEHNAAIYTTDSAVIADNLQKIGINVVQNLLTTAVRAPKDFVNRNFDMAEWQYFAGPDPSIALANSFICSEIGKGLYTNAAGYCNPAADKLIIAAQTELNATTRRQDMLNWQKMILTDLPGTALIDDNFALAYDTSYVGAPGGPWGVSTMFADRIYWTKGTPIAASTSSTSSTTAISSTTSTTPLASTTSQATQTSSISTPQASPAASTGMNTTLLAVIAVIVVILIIVGAVVASRRKRPG